MVVLAAYRLSSSDVWVVVVALSRLFPLLEGCDCLSVIEEDCLMLVVSDVMDCTTVVLLYIVVQ